MKNIPTRSLNRTDGAKLLLAAVFALFVLMPLVRMFLYMDLDSIGKVLTGKVFPKALGNSLVAALIATAISLALGYVLALCTERSGMRHSGLWNTVLVLPMLIPSISHGMGLIVLLGNNGLLTRLLGLSSGIYGLWGIVIGSVMYSFPVAYLMLRDILKYQDQSPYEAARILGIPRWRQFTAITLPYLRKPLISVVFAVFTMIVTDYGVPLVVGGKYTTLPVVMYQEVIGQLDFGKGAVYGVFLLIPAVIAFLFDFFNKDKGNASFLTRSQTARKPLALTAAATAFCGLVALLVALPLVAFLLQGFAKNYPTDMSFTLANIQKALKLGAGKYLLNSIAIAALVSVAGVVISFLTAYFTARMPSRVSRLLHLSAITSAAIPGIVLGLSYVITFKGSFLYGTIAILVVVNTVHFIASPYSMMYNCLSKLNGNLESVGQTLGIRRLRMIWDVFIPQSAYTVCEMLSYFFVNCMMTISAVSFLATTANKPVALMINQFEAQAQLACAAVVSLLIFLVNLTVKALTHLAKNRLAGSRKDNT